MFQEDAAGIQLYECQSLNARITAKQCRINRRRASETSLFDERLNAGHLRPCLDCEGVLGEFKKKKRNKFEGLIKCSGCRGHKRPDQFGLHYRTGERKTRCLNCDAHHRKNNHKRRKGRSGQAPPRLNLSSPETSLINHPAIRAFGLENYDFYCVYWSGGNLFLHAAQEKHSGYYGFRTNSGSQAKKCSARAIRRTIGVEGEARYLMYATEDPLTFRLVEETA